MKAVWHGALLTLLTIPACVQAGEMPLPPPPPQPEWIEPVPLLSKLHVQTHSCDGEHGTEFRDKDLEWTWNKTGALTVTGRVMHNGVESVDSKDVRAWLAGDRVVISYLLKSADFPEAPSVACPGFTHFDIRIDGLKTRPDEVVIYPSRIDFLPAEVVPVRTPTP